MDDAMPFGGPNWEPVPSWEPVIVSGAGATQSFSNALPIERFRDIQPQLTGLWLIKRLLPAEGLALIYGHPGCGKSFLALDMSFHIALGRDWHGRRVKQGFVIYIGAEGLAGVRNRVTAFRLHTGVEDAAFTLIPTPIDLQAPDADVNRLATAIRAEATHFDMSPALIVVDTLSKTFGAGKENTDDMATYIANCGRIAAEFKCCVMPVHHRPKDAESEEPRGHGSLKGGVDTVILVEAGPTKKARVTKQKDGELGEAMLFKLKSIELGEDEDGEPVTSCVVEPSLIDTSIPADPIAQAVGRLPDGPKLVLKQLMEVIERDGIAPPADIPDAEINRQRVGKIVLTGTWREKVIMGGGTERDTNRDTAKKAFNRALTRLQKDGIVRVWGDYAWRDWGASGHAGTL
jgi:KaiC/GvpD/RAD55 family RecA-like ATPase